MSWSISLINGMPLTPSEATQDIPVFKIMEITHMQGIWMSLEYGRLYEAGKVETLETPLEPKPEPDESSHTKWTIAEGFHSYAPGEVKVVKANLDDKFPDDLKMYHHGIKTYSFDEKGINRYVAMECVIPKGATFYYDDRHKEYVSDKIKITGAAVPLWRFRI